MKLETLRDSRIGQRLVRADRASSLFIILAALFGLFFVFSTPLLWGADETSHVGRVYQISQGHVFAHVVHQGYSGYGFGGTIPSNLLHVIDYVNVDFNVNTHQVINGVKWVDNPADYQAFARLPLSGKQVDYNFSNTAIYSPISYIPSVMGFKLAEITRLRIGPSIYLARLCDLAFYIAVVGFLLYALREYRAKWLVFTIALLPMGLYQASTITADTVTNVMALAVVALVAKALLDRKRSFSRAELTLLLIGVISLPVLKPSYLFISLTALLVPLDKLPRLKYTNFIMPMAVALGLLAYGLWQYKTSYLTNSAKYIIAGVVPWWQQIDSSGQMKYVITHPLSFIADFFRTVILTDNIYVESMFGRLSFDNVQVPAIAILTSLAAMLLSIGGMETLNRTKKSVSLLVFIVLISIAAVFGTLYLTISAVGQNTIQGVQGRYFLPILPVFLLLISYVTSLRFSLQKISAYTTLAKCIAGLVFISLLFSAIKFYYVTWG